jgi:hypothetical protein
MKTTPFKLFLLLLTATALVSCSQNKKQTKQVEETTDEPSRFDIYTPVPLITDLSQLSENDKLVIPKLIEAAKVMDELFWMQAYGDKSQLLDTISDEKVKQFAIINYGPWDRLDGNKPFIDGAGEKPKGATFYPVDVSAEELMSSDLPDKDGLYSVVRRDESGALVTIPYSQEYGELLQKASDLLKEAASITDNPSFEKYLNLRAEALLTDDYRASDIAWLQLEDNTLDIIIGPIENYEDALLNARAAFESYVLVKDKEWSEKLKKYVAYLPELQADLPVDDAYKQEKPGTDAQLNAYDVIYYAGDCNSGSKTIAVNLPNDEAIQLEYGTRRSQLKNAMRAKFEKILVPISEVLIAEEQRKHVTFNAFFANTMFHEVAHGLGIKNTITGKGTVRKALQEQFSALEEGKADILGLYMVTNLKRQGVLEEGELMDYYVTFMASIFRSVRFGASSAHGKANMLRFNYFREMGAFERMEDGTYQVNPEKLEKAMNSLSERILMLQGDGDKDAVASLMAEKGQIGSVLQSDLDRLTEQNIPVDIVFEQGVDVLGL